MTLTLYTNPMSRGRTVRWMLEELGVPHDTVVLDYGPAMRTPEFLDLNPMGKVPVLVHEGGVVTEGAAICLWLAEAFPEAGLMPADRGAALRWMFFGAGPLEQAVVNGSLGWEAPADRQGRLGYGSMDRVLETLSGHLADRAYFCGDFSVVDVYLGAQIGWGLRFGSLPETPALRAYAARVMARPAAIRAAAIDDALMGR